MKADELFFVKKYRGIATDGMDLKKRDGFFLRLLEPFIGNVLIISRKR